MSYIDVYSYFLQLDGLGKRFRSSRQVCYSVIENMVKSRQAASVKNGGDKQQDFLGALLRDKVSKNSDSKTLRDTLVTLLFAGRDNVQNVLSWSLYELSRSPEWMERLRDEANKVRRTVGTLRYEELQVSAHMFVLSTR